MTNGGTTSKLKVTLVTAFASILVATIGAVAGAVAAPRVVQPNVTQDDVRQIVRNEDPYNRDQRLILSSLNRQERQLAHIEDEITNIKIKLAKRGR